MRSTAWVIGRTEIRRRIRSLRGNGMQLLALILGIGFMGLFALAGVAGLYFFGSGLHAGEFDAPLSQLKSVVVYMWLFVAGLSGYRIYATGLEPDHSDGLLTTVSHRELIGGLVVAELLLWGIPTVILGAIGALAFAGGAQSPATAPLLFITVCAIVTLGILTGFGLALAVKNTGVRSRLLTRLRTVFLVLLGVAYFGVMITQSFASVADPLVSVFVRTPLAWFGDLTLLAISEHASLVRSLGAVGITVAGVAAAPTLLGTFARWFWFTDPVRLEHGEAETTDSDTDSASSGMASVLPRPIYGVARVDWHRARRAPITLSFVLYPLIVLAMPVTSTIQTGTVGTSLPILITLCGGWITGTLFTLNILGNEGAVLPVTALGVSSGRTLVVGHVAAGVLVGGPLTAIGTASLAVVSPLPLALAGTLTLSAVGLALCAGPIASGIGTLFPRFESVSVSRSREAIIPSTIAFAVYSIILLVAAVPTLLSHSLFVNDYIVEWTGLSPLVVGLLGTGTTVVIASLLGVLSLSRASRAVDGFHFD